MIEESSIRLYATENNSFFGQMETTFLASLRSVGTACTLAGIGIYLHRRQFILEPNGKRTLALISQQVTIPLLFFTKILYCNQDWSTDPCPDITTSLRTCWSLVIWPLYVVSVGLFVGWVAAKISQTPTHQVRAVWVACAFGNSTGLPITLLTVVHTNFPSNTDLGRFDPTLFLSIYLLLYPVLQWGIGGYLLAPPSSSSSSSISASNPTSATGTRSSWRATQNVLAIPTTNSYTQLHRGMTETDASLYISIPDHLNQLGVVEDDDNDDDKPSRNMDNSNLTQQSSSDDMIKATETQKLLLSMTKTTYNENNSINKTNTSTSSSSSSSPPSSSNVLWIHQILQRCFQPPVIGALLGIVIASLPQLRGIFVDIIDRQGHAPLQWIFDGLYHVGQSAVPINMIILGCNLSASYQSNQYQHHKSHAHKIAITTTTTTTKNTPTKAELFSNSTTLAIVVGKMVVMPILGFLSTYLIKKYYWNDRIPDEIDGGVYLVAMIVFLTPTANNVMVMVELSGTNNGSSKQAMARIIFWQYLMAPILLSMTMTIAVAIAVRWS